MLACALTDARVRLPYLDSVVVTSRDEDHLLVADRAVESHSQFIPEPTELDGNCLFNCNVISNAIHCHERIVEKREINKLSSETPHGGGAKTEVQRAMHPRCTSRPRGKRNVFLGFCRLKFLNLNSVY